MAVSLNLRRRIVGEVDEDFLAENREPRRAAVVLGLEFTLVIDKGHQVQAGQVAGRVVEEHVLGAGITRVDAARVLDRVPLVDRGVVLNAGVAADMRRFRHRAKQHVGPNRVDRLARDHRLSLPCATNLGRLHEIFSHAHRVVCVLEED